MQINKVIFLLASSLLISCAHRGYEASYNKVDKTTEAQYLTQKNTRLPASIDNKNLHLYSSSEQDFSIIDVTPKRYDWFKSFRSVKSKLSKKSVLIGE